MGCREARLCLPLRSLTPSQQETRRKERTEARKVGGKVGERKHLLTLHPNKQDSIIQTPRTEGRNTNVPQ